MAQLERIDSFLAKRREIMAWYRAGLGSDARLRLNRDAEWARNVYWMVCVEVEGITDERRQALMAALRERGVDSRPYFYPISDMPIYPGADTPVTHRYSRAGMNLPSFVDLTEDDVRFVCSQFLSALDHLEG